MKNARIQIATICITPLSFYALNAFIKSIDAGEKWRIISSGISLAGFFTILLLLLIQQLKNKKAKI